jgi:hypothetical protein
MTSAELLYNLSLRRTSGRQTKGLLLARPPGRLSKRFRGRRKYDDYHNHLDDYNHITRTLTAFVRLMSL